MIRFPPTWSKDMRALIYKQPFPVMNVTKVSNLVLAINKRRQLVRKYWYRFIPQKGNAAERLLWYKDDEQDAYKNKLEENKWQL